jgi:hypothetical protein
MLMPVKINWTLNLQVPGGPKISDSQAVEAGAYDLIEVLLEQGAVDKEVGLQPGNAQVKLLLIKSDHYGAKLTYKTNDGSATSGLVELDGPHLLFSPGAIKLLTKAPVKALFSNDLDEAATIQILVARDASPSP